MTESGFTEADFHRPCYKIVRMQFDYGKVNIEMSFYIIYMYIESIYSPVSVLNIFM